jgi:signal transduction histidine kinase
MGPSMSRSLTVPAPEVETLSEAPRPERAIVALIVFLTVLTVASVVSSDIAFGYASMGAKIAITTADGMIAAMVAFLVYGRLRREPSLRNILLLFAFAMLATTNLAFSTLPETIAPSRPEFSVWAPIGGRAIAALLLAVAAWAPRRPIRDVRRVGLFFGGVYVVCTVAVISMVATLSQALPVIDAGTANEALAEPQFDADLRILVLKLATTGLFFAAGVGFLRRARVAGDDLMAWFALASPLAAFGALHTALSAPLAPGVLYLSDVLRLGFYVVLMIGAVRELARYYRDQARTAMFEERRRLAREFHDGLAQELAVIVTSADRLEGDTGSAARIKGAAQRALDEVRLAISALASSTEAPLGAAVIQTAEDIAERFDVNIVVDVRGGVTADASTQESLVRIAREAMMNAARHAGATKIDVLLSDGDSTRLIVRDDGQGFDPMHVPEGRFGLVSMRERTEAIGGRLSVSTGPGRGTEVEVSIP